MHMNNKNKLNKHASKCSKPVGHDKAEKRSPKLHSMNLLDIHTHVYTLNSMLYKLKLQKRIRVGKHIKQGGSSRKRRAGYKNVLTCHFQFSRPDCLVRPQPYASPKPN